MTAESTNFDTGDSLYMLSSVVKYSPFILPIILVLVLIFFGKETYAAYRKFDNWLGAVLKPIPGIIGVNRIPYDASAIWFRRFQILSFFFLFLGTAVWMILNPQIKYSGVIELVAIAITYLFALSIAKQWVLNENYILEGHREGATPANHLKNVGAFSIAVLVVSVPISLHAVNDVFGLVDDAKVTGGFGFWAWYSLRLLYDAFADLGSFFIPENYGNIGDEPPVLKAIVFFHVLVFTFIVIQGAMMLAKGEYALTNALWLMKKNGDIEKIVPFGERITDELYDFLEHRDPHLRGRSEDEDLRPIRVRRTHACSAIKALGEIATTDRNCTKAISHRLISVFRTTDEIHRSGERKAAGEALWRIADKLVPPFINFPGGPKLLNEIRQVIREVAYSEEAGVGVRVAAIEGLTELNMLVNAGQVEALAEMLRDTRSSQLKREISQCLFVHREIVADPKPIAAILIPLYMEETDPVMRNVIGCALDAYDDTVIEGEVAESRDVLFNDSSEVTQRVGAVEFLSANITTDEIALRALVTRSDQSEGVRRAIAKGLGEASRFRRRADRLKVFEALARYLDDEEFCSVRKDAGRSLGRFVRERETAGDILGARLLVESRISAIRVICKSLANLEALENLIDGLSSDAVGVRDSIAKALTGVMVESYGFSEEKLDRIKEVTSLPEAVEISPAEIDTLKQFVAEQMEEYQAELV